MGGRVAAFALAASVACLARPAAANTSARIQAKGSASGCKVHVLVPAAQGRDLTTKETFSGLEPSRVQMKRVGTVEGSWRVGSWAPDCSVTFEPRPVVYDHYAIDLTPPPSEGTTVRIAPGLEFVAMTHASCPAVAPPLGPTCYPPHPFGWAWPVVFVARRHLNRGHRRAHSSRFGWAQPSQWSSWPGAT